MSSKKELQIWVDNELWYTLVGTKLIRAGSDWTTTGSVACELVDRGDGITIVFNDKKIKLEYYQIIELLVMLTQFNDSKIDLVKTKTIRTI